MVESSQNSAAFKPSDEEQELITQHLGPDAIVDEQFKNNPTLTKEQAERRCQLIEDVEYDFQLALKKGDYYLGKAVINFYLKSMPGKNELFLSSQAMAIGELMINDKEKKGNECFKE